MQDRAKSELGLRLKKDRAESELELRLKQDRSEGGHALASLALTEQWFLLTTAHFASQSNFLWKLVCIRTTFLMKSLSLQY